ncbi:MAG: type II toxin-antitoxin system VapB family antitoxin [Chloroflexi bacterium]|nr:type II toxin-antitoxin system VapB family antitoxin [Chloroflexota bacterium]
MSLNIKNAETYRLVKELAEATGESMTTAVTEAVRERLGRIRAERGVDHEARVQRILDMAAAMRERAPAGYFDQDFDALLYDERGLPK